MRIAEPTASRLIAIACATAVCSGCASVPTHLDTAANRDLCQKYLDADAQGGSLIAMQPLTYKLTQSGLTESDCKKLTGRTDTGKTVAGIAAVAALAVVIARAGKSGGYTAPTAIAPAAPQDYSWAWDQFYNENWQLVWACRGMQSGQFA